MERTGVLGTTRQIRDEDGLERGIKNGCRLISSISIGTLGAVPSGRWKGGAKGLSTL